jgi:hypothetical protein
MGTEVAVQSGREYLELTDATLAEDARDGARHNLVW